MTAVLSSNRVVPNWGKMLKIGAVSAVLSIALIPIQIIVFAVWPPPTDIIDWFELFQRNWFLGLLSLDLLYILNNSLIILVYLALYVALRKIDETLMAIGLAVGFIGIAAYFSSNTSFEMWALSRKYSAAVTPAQQESFVAAGEAMLVTYTGSAFDVYYVLNAITLLLFAWVMLKGDVFSRATAIWGLVAGVFMIIPSTAGMVGLTFSLLSLIPWIVFCILMSRRLFLLGQLDQSGKIMSTLDGPDSR